mmetsp:Transcript_12738/g.27550  ORF Transcript_12738/g.27550 Transcript_12738/m.27550 type:complete len:194 (+) Transcript_12738:133-714(+)
MASSKAKATYKTNGYATWKSDDEPGSSSLSFLKSWFGDSSAKVKPQHSGNKEPKHPNASQGGDHKRVDSLDLGRRLGHCYAEGAKRSSLGTSGSGSSKYSGGAGRSEHSQLSVATQLSLSSSGKVSRSGHRAKIDHCNRRMPSCAMYKYDAATGLATPVTAPVGGANGGGDAPPSSSGPNSKSKHVVVMEPGD